MGSQVIPLALYFEVIMLVLQNFEDVNLGLIPGSVRFQVSEHAAVSVTSRCLIEETLLAIGMTQSDIDLLIV